MWRIAIALVALVMSACATAPRARADDTDEAGGDAEAWRGWPGSTAIPPPDLDPASHRDREWDPVDDTPLDALPEGIAEEDAADEADESDAHGEERAAAEIAEADGGGAAEPSTAASSKRGRLAGTKTGRAIARAASRWVGLRSLRRISRRVPDDCSGLVRLAYRRVGLDPIALDGRRGDNAVTAMWRRAYRLKALKRSGPRPGDLIFFRNTWDRNGDGKRNDGLTHVAIVERVDADGTVTFIHRSGQGVNRMRMNPRHRSQITLKGKRINDYLRRPDGTKAPRLTGQLFAGYASVKVFQGDAQRQARRSPRKKSR